MVMQQRLCEIRDEHEGRSCCCSPTPMAPGDVGGKAECAGVERGKEERWL